MLTNWETISNSIKRLNVLDERLSGDLAGLTKKETLQMTRERDKLERSLGGIKEMGGIASAVFVIDTNKEELAIAEAKKLGIPVIAVLDTNCNPENIDFPIPGNDDATRAIDLYCNLIADAVLEGIQQELSSQGVDVGAMEAPVEEIPVVAEEAPAQEAPAEDVKSEEVPASEEKTEEKSS
jgi:small subunit ribosomal protein S2